MVELKAIYKNIPTGIMADSTTTGTYEKNYSTHFVDYADFKTIRNVPQYATLEQDRNLLDGDFENVPDDPVGYGYVSTIVTDADGNFSDDIVITRTYTHNYSAPRLIY